MEEPIIQNTRCSNCYWCQMEHRDQEGRPLYFCWLKDIYLTAQDVTKNGCKDFLPGTSAIHHEE